MHSYRLFDPESILASFNGRERADSDIMFEFKHPTDILDLDAATLLREKLILQQRIDRDELRIKYITACLKLISDDERREHFRDSDCRYLNRPFVAMSDVYRRKHEHDHQSVHNRVVLDGANDFKSGTVSDIKFCR